MSKVWVPLETFWVVVQSYANSNKKLITSSRSSIFQLEMVYFINLSLIDLLNSSFIHRNSSKIVGGQINDKLMINKA